MANVARPGLIERPPGNAGINANKDPRAWLIPIQKGDDLSYVKLA